MRRAPSGFCKHVVPIEIEKFVLSRGPPRKSVDPVKTERMVDSKKMKTIRNRANALPPPIEIALAHFRPAIKRDAPVLSPLLRELVVLEMRFRRRAAEPIERELVRPREDVGTVVADPEWNVAHQRDAALVGVAFDFRPLVVRDPLYVTKQIFVAQMRLPPILRLLAQPGMR